MALFKYFKTAVIGTGTLPDPHGPLSRKVPSSTIVEANRQVLEVIEKKGRGEYNKLSPEDNMAVGKYASEHGVAKAMRRLKEKGVKETSVKDWKKAYGKELKERCKCAALEDVRVESLPCKKCGRPPLLSEKLDKYLQELIVEMRSRGTPIGSTIVVAVTHEYC